MESEILVLLEDFVPVVLYVFILIKFLSSGKLV